MGRKKLYWLLGAEAALAAAFSILSVSIDGAFTTALSFPMEQIGLLLKPLSLWNRFGNALALAIYAAVSLLPLVYLAWARSRRGKQREDALLILLCPLLFYVLYMMINPHKLPGVFAAAATDEGIAIAKAVLGGAVYSVALCYALFRLMARLKDGGAEVQKRYLRLLLYALAAIFVLSAAGALFNGLLTALREFGSKNSSNHILTQAFMVLRFVVEALPYVLGVVTAVYAADMLASLDGEGAVDYAKKLSDWCVKHGVALMGHPTSSSDCELMKHFDVPGEDLSWRSVEHGTELSSPDSVMAKCTADAARHMGASRNSNECFALCGAEDNPWDFTARDMMRSLNFLFARGVNMIIPHAFYYSLRTELQWGERPPDVGPNNIWWEDYRRIAGYIKRMSWFNAMNYNNPCCAVLCSNDFMPVKATAGLLANSI